MYKEVSDEELLNLYFEGDGRAFDEFFKRHFGRVLGYARKLGLSDADAADAAQESFLKVHRQIHSYERGRKVLPWFFTIVHNTCLTHLRSEKRRILRENKAHEQRESHFQDLKHFPLQQGPVSEEQENNPLSLEDAELRKRFEKLKSEERTLLCERIVEEQSYKDISQKTGKSEAALRKMFQRALSQLKGISKG
ncbi:MAG: hypothetical protein RIR26_2742 [Pseudomonadota bacterium]|jgi:RNA polymerase sigma-70 factor (ECF subfamily)